MKINVRQGLYDIAIADRIRTARIAGGWTQERLADVVGVTFQQIQKYEKGSNRISAGRLMQIAEALGLPISSFFPESGGERAPIPALSRADIDILEGLAALDPGARKALRSLILAMGAAGGRGLLLAASDQELSCWDRGSGDL